MLLHNEQGLLTTGWGVFHCTVNEATAEWSPEGDVIRTAAPMPALGGRPAAQQACVTWTLCHISCTARAGDCMNQAGSHYCMDERCLFRPFKKINKIRKDNLSKMPILVKCLQMWKEYMGMQDAQQDICGKVSQCSSIRAEEGGKVFLQSCMKKWANVFGWEIS